MSLINSDLLLQFCFILCTITNIYLKKKGWRCVCCAWPWGRCKGPCAAAPWWAARRCWSRRRRCGRWRSRAGRPAARVWAASCSKRVTRLSHNHIPLAYCGASGSTCWPTASRSSRRLKTNNRCFSQSSCMFCHHWRSLTNTLSLLNNSHDTDIMIFTITFAIMYLFFVIVSMEMWKERATEEKWFWFC